MTHSRFAIDPEVYATVGVTPGRRLPQYTSIGSYTIIYQDVEGDVYCARCATRHRGFYPIKYASVFYEGAPEECAECGKPIESSYGV
jgi:hypothetical protein